MAHTNPVDREHESDALDAALTRALQVDGRATVSELAQRLGTSRDVITHRMKLLTTRGGLRVVAALDPGFAGHHVLIHAMVDVNGAAAPVAERIASLSEAVFVSLTTGEHPIVFESRHRDTNALQLLLNRVRVIPGVRRVRVTTYDEILSGFFVARQRAEISTDDIDYELIELLQRDGRMSYRELGETVHLSSSTVRARVQRLVDAGVIRISAITSGKLTHSRLAVGIGITARGDGSAVEQALLAAPEIDLAARSHGSFDFIGTIVGNSATQLLAALERFRALPSTGRIETWTHFDIVKESYERTYGRALG